MPIAGYFLDGFFKQSGHGSFPFHTNLRQSDFARKIGDPCRAMVAALIQKQGIRRLTDTVTYNASRPYSFTGIEAPVVNKLQY